MHFQTLLPPSPSSLVTSHCPLTSSTSPTTSTRMGMLSPFLLTGIDADRHVLASNMVTAAVISYSQPHRLIMLFLGAIGFYCTIVILVQPPPPNMGFSRFRANDDISLRYFCLQQMNHFTLTNSRTTKHMFSGRKMNGRDAIILEPWNCKLIRFSDGTFCCVR